MTVEDMKKAIEQLKADGNDEQAVLGGFYRMFQEDEITLDELDGIVNLMGYHLTEEFKNMSPEDQKTKGVEETEASKEEIEDAKEIDDDESDSDDDESDSDDDESDSDDDESEEEKKANKLFGFDKK